MKIADILPFDWGKNSRREVPVAVTPEVQDPFAAMDRLFTDILAGTPFGLTPSELPRGAPVNVHEEAGRYTIDVAVPGMDAGDLDVRIDGDWLTIRGSHEERHEGKSRVCEFRYGQFERVLRLPRDADVQTAQAEYKNGVLQISLVRVQAEPAGRCIPVHTG